MSKVHPSFERTLTIGMAAVLQDARWTRPRNYVGPDHDGFVVATRNRDSDAIERSNFETMRRDLAPWPGAWTIVRDSNWAVGWTESILLYQDAPRRAKIEAATNLMHLREHPVLDETNLSELESEELQDAWDDWGMRDTVSEVAGMLEHRHGFDDDDAESIAERFATIGLLERARDALESDGSMRHNGSECIIPTRDLAENALEDALARNVLLERPDGTAVVITADGQRLEQPSYAEAFIAAARRTVYAL